MTPRFGLPFVLVFLITQWVTAADAQADDARRAARRTPVVDVYEASRDAVVNISSTEIVTVRSRRPGSIFEEFFDMPRHGRTQQLTRQSVGSGFVIHPDGYIVTNAHVVAQTTQRKVIFADGGEYEATIVAADESCDLAVLKVEAGVELPTLPLGRSDDLMIGETVIAIGNPLGYQSTVTAGVVSALGREIAITDELRFTDLIQTDASINPGNSGGPLLNVHGELIGVNSAIRGDAENIGFAIPVDQLRAVLPALLDVERRYRLVSGLRVDTLAEPRVIEVRAGSPAERGGVRRGDVLLAIDGKPVREGVDFDIALLQRRPGDRLRLTVGRGGEREAERGGERELERVECTIELGARPAPDGMQLGRERLGVEIQPLSESMRRRLRLGRAAGLLVVSVEPQGPGSEAGVFEGDILLAIGRHYVTSPDDLGQILEMIDPGEVVAVRILRVERMGKVQRSGPIRVR